MTISDVTEFLYAFAAMLTALAKLLRSIRRPP
jgi:hypothetical protein